MQWKLTLKVNMKLEQQDRSRTFAAGWAKELNRSNNASRASTAGLAIKSEIDANWLDNRCTIKQAKQLIDAGAWHPSEKHHHGGGRFKGRKVVKLIEYFDLQELDKLLDGKTVVEALADGVKKLEAEQSANTLVVIKEQSQQESPYLWTNQWSSTEGTEVPAGWQRASEVNIKGVFDSPAVPGLEIGKHYAFIEGEWYRTEINKFRKLGWRRHKHLILPKDKRKLAKIKNAVKQFIKAN